MSANALIRQIHRWVSIVFAAIVAGIFAALGIGQRPAQWVYLTPLAPLFVLAVTGLYMFALPYFLRRNA